MLQTTYRENTDNDVAGYLEVTFNDVSYERQYKKIKVDNKTIYYGQSHFAEKNNKSQILDPKKYGPNHLFAFVVDDKTQQFVELVYSFYCYDENACNINAKEEEEFFEKIYKSVQFNKK